VSVRLYTAVWCVTAHRTPPVDALEQHRQLRSRQRNRSVRRQVNFPPSSRFASRHSPSPSHHSSVIRSPRFPRNANTCLENGSSASTGCTGSMRSLPTIRAMHFACPCSGNMQRQQVRRLAILAQQPLPILTSPRKHLVGIHSVRPADLGHRRAWLQRLLDNPPLLRHRPPPARLSLNDHPFRSVHVLSSGHFPMCSLGPSSFTQHNLSRRLADDAYLFANPSPRMKEDLPLTKVSLSTRTAIGKRILRNRNRARNR
jgi:hypothetical protein